MGATPATEWARTHHRGRPGYSSRGLDAVSPSADTPLSVAGRIVDQRISDAVREECLRRREAGESFEAVESFREEMLGLNGIRFVAWEWLCGSFDAVVAVLTAELDAAPKKQWLRPLLRQARAAQRRAS